MVGKRLEFNREMTAAETVQKVDEKSPVFQGIALERGVRETGD
jgi:hypothetical protein